MDNPSTVQILPEFLEFIKHRPENNTTNVLNDNFSVSGIKTSTNIIQQESLIRHDAEPIKQINQINMVIDYCLKRNRYRDLMLFIVGINFGLRVSDLRKVRFKDLINNDMTFKDSFSLIEVKTRNTKGNKRIVFSSQKMQNLSRESQIEEILSKIDEEIDNKKKKAIKPRTIYINNAVKIAVKMYIDYCIKNNVREITLDDYLFVSDSNNKTYEQLSYVNDEGKKIFLDIMVQSPLSDSAIQPILKNIMSNLGIKGRFSTHAYRKTFCWHLLNQKGDEKKYNQRKLDLLQAILGHSSQATTLHYAGITEDTVKDVYMNLNLGLEELLKWIND